MDDCALMKSRTSLKFYFFCAAIHGFYIIYATKISMSTPLKIRQQWKFTLTFFIIILISTFSFAFRLSIST